MTHVSEGMLQAFLDDALTPADRAVVESHVNACPACAAELEALREAAANLSAALRLLEPVVPAVPTAAIAWRASAARTAHLRQMLLRAATIVVGLGVVGAAALPGSPVRGWVSAAWELGMAWIARDSQPVEPAPAAAPAPPTAEIGIPVEDEMSVVLTGMAPGARVTVRLVEQGPLLVRLGRAPSSQAFRTGPGRVEVLGGGIGDDVRVDVPRDVRAATIEANGRIEVLKDGGRLRLAESPVPGGQGAEVVFRVRR